MQQLWGDNVWKWENGMFRQQHRSAEVQVGTKRQDSFYLASAIQKLVIAAKAIVLYLSMIKRLNEQLCESYPSHLCQFSQIPGINQLLD